MRLAVLCSGRGTNLQAVLDAIDARALDAEVCGVFSDRPAAPALQRVSPSLRWGQAVASFATRADYEQALTAAVAAVRPDLVVCAGYMRILSAEFIAAQHGRIINIHPSLLPAYPGLDTHARVLAAGDPWHGATVHQVIPALDAGPILGFTRLRVQADDTPATLAARVLGAEHPLLLAVLKRYAEGGFKLNENGPVAMDHPEFKPIQLECAQ